jgi:hypothetical protein
MHVTFFDVLLSPCASPEIDPAHLVASTRTVLEHALYPGIANCATKVSIACPCWCLCSPFPPAVALLTE